VGLVLALLVQGEVEISVYAGRAWTLETDVDYLDQTTENPNWDNDPPTCLGARVAYFFDDWGIALDVSRSDIELGDPAPGVDGLALDYYLVTANLIYRYQGTLTPYFGAGMGIVIADVDATFGGERVDDRQIEAPAAQAFLGLALGPLFVEARIAYGDLELDVPFDRLETHLVTPQAVAGLTISF
jgi:hypothetical protein